nr:MAG TPA: hypothetical protein [Bacteriophage sp.]
MSFYSKLSLGYNTQGFRPLRTPAPGVSVSACLLRCVPLCYALRNSDLCRFCPYSMPCNAAKAI